METNKLSKKALKAVVKATPLIGNVLDNVESNDGGKGKIHWGKLAYSAIRIALTIIGAKYGVNIVL